MKEATTAKLAAAIKANPSQRKSPSASRESSAAPSMIKMEIVSPAPLREKYKSHLQNLPAKYI